MYLSLFYWDMLENIINVMQAPPKMECFKSLIEILVINALNLPNDDTSFHYVLSRFKLAFNISLTSTLKPNLFII